MINDRYTNPFDRAVFGPLSASMAALTAGGGAVSAMPIKLNNPAPGGSS